MKIRKLFAGILSLFVLASCSLRESGKENTADSFSESAVGEENSGDLHKETISSDVGETAWQIAVPAEGTPGVYFADSFASLENILESEEFLTYPQRVTLCITKSFILEKNLVVCRDVDVLYLPEVCEWENTLTVRCGSEVETLHISTSAEALLNNGYLYIDAPYASLEVTANRLPDTEALTVYCNVARYNGQTMEAVYGGKGTSYLADVVLTDSSTGKAYDGVTLQIKGNTAEIQLPLIVKEKDVTDAKLIFITEDGETSDTVNMELTTVNSFTTVDNLGEKRVYRITSERLSYDLPVVEIHTDGGEPIVEKNTYIHGTLTVDGTSYPMKVRGRGNASWNMFPKKAYRIKLDNGASPFDLPQNRDWVLCSNYADKTLIRNCVAHTIAASLSGLDYTPTHIPVHLYLNGSYMGVYTFADKIEEGNGKLNLGGQTNPSTGEDDLGFLLEIGWDFDEENVYNRDYFDTEIVFRIFIKEPKIEQPNTPELLYIKKYILEMENAIVTNNGWEDYIDIDAWVDWLIVNELTFNTESSFYRSCYLWREAGGKLKLGPVWDFDMAFGNHQGDLPGYDGWCTTESTYTYISENWMNYLMGYDKFTSALTERWNEVKEDLKKTALDAVDTYSSMLDGSQQQNFLVWNIMGVSVGASSVNPKIYDTYEKQVQYLRDFIDTRWEYIDTRLNNKE